MARFGFVWGAALVLAGCSGGTTSPETDKLLTEAAKVKEPDIEVYAKRIAATEYPLYLSLLKASGLEAELGGREAADASLRELLAQFEAQSTGTKADMPKLIKTALGEESGYGFSGLAASSMIGMTFGLYARQMKSGEQFDKNDKDGKLSVKTGDKGVQTQTEMTGNIGNGLTGKIASTVNFDFCPDADGKVNVTFKSNTSLTKAGTKAGANLSISVDGAMYYDDDAKLTNEWDAKMRIEHAAFDGKGKGAYIDASFEVTKDNPTGSGNINRASSQATEDDVKVVMAQQQMAQLMAMMILHFGKDAMESGRCVELKATATPGQRNRVPPSTGFSILAQPRSKLDGQPAGGTVLARLEGEGLLDPANTKVKADATFSYTAPSEKQKRGVVKMEARSKRGIGLAELDFDTMANAFFAEGGLDAYHGTGTICDFSKPFQLSGSGVVNSFVPTGPNKGTYSYKGAIGGFAVWGAGTWHVELKPDGSGGLLWSTGPGSVKTPMGVRTARGTERYELTPAKPC